MALFVLMIIGSVCGRRAAGAGVAAGGDGGAEHPGHPGSTTCDRLPVRNFMVMLALNS